MTTTATLRLKSCPRCKGPLSLRSDKFGGYWDCICCGYNGHADVPPVPRIARGEFAKAYNSVFDYDGSEKAFKRLRIRGRLLIPKGTQTTPRFDLGCPYRNCSRRQLIMPTGSHKAYRCKNNHRIFLNVETLTWR